jgi:hypothetical protein
LLKAWRLRNARKVPVRSNFFLNFFSALSMGSPSFTGMISMLLF